MDKHFSREAREKSFAHLVPEEEVGLAELKVLEVLGLGEGDPDAVEGGKEPATSRTLLVGDGLDLVHL